MNTNFSTLGNGALNRSGGAMTGVLSVISGSSSAPGLSSVNQATTGFVLDTNLGQLWVGGTPIYSATSGGTLSFAGGAAAISATGAITSNTTITGNGAFNSGGGYQIGGTLVINNSRQIVNSTADAALIATGTMAPARLGTGAPSNSVYLRGDGTWAPVLNAPSVVVVGVPYTASYDQFVLTTGTGTVTLPTPVGNINRVIDVKNYGTGVITVATAAGVIDSIATYVLAAQNQSVTVISDGNNWWIR